MSMLVAAFVGLCLYGVIRMLNLASPSSPPNIYAKSKSSEFIQAIISSCPILREPYIPPFLWGKSGHIQTVVYAKMGRYQEPVPSGVRHSKTLQDGSNLTFDLFEPKVKHKSGGDYCLLVCPGFGSSSESSYVRALVNHALSVGFRVSVLNHLGSLFSVKLTTPRIFTYGGWEEFHSMREEVQAIHPQCQLIMIGLSMGANIVLKYLGERPDHQIGIVCAFSICQGYNINEAKQLLLKWENLRRAYLYTMTANQTRLIKHHSDILFGEDAVQQFGFDIKKIFSASTLEDLDVHFYCKLEGYKDVVAYYERNSCCNYINNINIPMILLNAEDDPIVPPVLLKYAQDYAENHDHAVFITTKHGGHLGYFERGYFRPHPVSWLDRCICEVANAVISYMIKKEQESDLSREKTEQELLDQLGGGNLTDFNAEKMYHNIYEQKSTIPVQTESGLARCSSAINLEEYCNQISSTGDGIASLNTGTGGLDDENNFLSDETASLSNGTASLNDRSASLKDGTASLNDRSASLKDETASLSDGTASLNDMSANLKDETASLSDGTASLNDRSASLKDGTASLNDRSASLKDETASLSDGTASLNDRSASLKDETASLSDGTASLSDGIPGLNDGTGSWSDVTASLSDGIPGLNDGTGSLSDETANLNDEIAILNDGTASLNDGIAGLNDRTASSDNGTSSSHSGTFSFKVKNEVKNSKLQDADDASRINVAEIHCQFPQNKCLNELCTLEDCFQVEGASSASLSLTMFEGVTDDESSEELLHFDTQLGASHTKLKDIFDNRMNPITEALSEEKVAEAEAKRQTDEGLNQRNKP